MGREGEKEGGRGRDLWRISRKGGREGGKVIK